MRVIPRSPAKYSLMRRRLPLSIPLGRRSSGKKRASAISSESGGRASVSGVQTNTAT